MSTVGDRTAGALTELTSRLAPDPRVTLCEVTVADGALTGVADLALGRGLAAFARTHGLRCRVDHPRPTRARVGVSRAAFRARPDAESERTNEALCGQALTLYDRHGPFARASAGRDGYLGWVHGADLDEAGFEPDRQLVALRGHAFAAPEVSAPVLMELAHGSRVREVRGPRGGWSEVALPGGVRGFVRSALIDALVAPRPEPTADALVAFARRFLETPYLWGGVSAWGLDCSGLTQTVYGAFGFALPRDADQQATLGEPIDADEARPADLLFFPGHVAIALGDGRLLHANAHHMRVTVDGFDRSDYGRWLRGRLSGVRRLRRRAAPVTPRSHTIP